MVAKVSATFRACAPADEGKQGENDQPVIAPHRGLE
jgi:hypothetical protein